VGRFVGLQTVLAGIALLVASGLLLLFFVAGNEAADRLSNWFFLAFYALMAWTVVEVQSFYGDVGGFVWVVTIVALVALAVLILSTLGVVLGLVEFTRVAIPTTVAFLVLMVWMLAVSILIVIEGGLPAALGWFGIGVLAVSLVMRGEKTPGPILNAAYGLILVGLTVWIVWLGAASTSAL
jgi:hypothetical protein